jgi:uncharacterized membrane protein YfcA
MELLGYIASALIGLSLGLIGGGGSILTVPVLVYLFGIHPSLAVAYSLFVVGTTSLIGAFNNYRKNQVDVRVAFLFGISSVATVVVARKIVMPMVPEHLFQIGNISVSKATATMIVFALLMLLASSSMIKEKKIDPKPTTGATLPTLCLLLYGIGIGLVTGFLGAGGGFLLVPALVLALKLPMKKAVGTSLFIIALNSLIGFVAGLQHHPTDWTLLGKVSSLAIVGILVGGRLANFIPGERLKKGFGWFVLIMGMLIVLQETIWK